MSTALTLIKHVWQRNGTTAWESLNHCMSDAVKLAVGAKLKWDKQDFDVICNTMRPGYWLGEHGWEWVYSLAIATEGHCFIKAFEAWTGRKPFIANGVCIDHNSGYSHHPRSHRQRMRLGLGSEVYIGSLRYRCTSISDDRIILTSRPSEGEKRKIRKLTHADCAKLWPAPKNIPPTRPPKGWVTRQTSLNAGNCKSGTDSFIENKVKPHIALKANVGDLTGAAITTGLLIEIDPVVARQLART